MFKIFNALLVILISTSCAQAAETDTLSQLKDKLSSHIGEISQINKSPVSGLFEIVTSDHIFYTDKSGQYLIDGNIFDLNTRSNLTEARSKKLFAINFNELPLQLAIKKVKGDGSRKMAIFTDPNCGYCKKLEHELLNVDNVTLYMFLYPLFKGSAEKVSAVWCSKDRLKAWENLMINGVIPAAGTCATPTDQVLALGKKYKVNGTPALIFANGVMNPGYMPAAELNKALDANQ